MAFYYSWALVSVVLKMLGAISWPWFWIVISTPIWIPIIFLLVVIIWFFFKEIVNALIKF